MSQSVTRLKQLLFDSEAQALVDLARKLDDLAAIDERGRAELRARLDEAMSRAVSRETLTDNVAEIIDEALRRAEVSRHGELSRAIAPVIVSTIKIELRNSQDAMVEALYPITGRLVKSYVASAIKDLSEQMNRRLEQNAFMLRLQSLATGKSVAELALAGVNDFDIEDLYLIRRGSGELIAHWPDRGDAGRDHLMSGVLAAVTEFANEALAADASSLRQIDLGDSAVYLRGSPLYLLAAKCTGAAPEGIEQLLDDAFVIAVERQNDLGDVQNGSAVDRTAQLASLGDDLKDSIAAQKASTRRRTGMAPLKMLLAMIFLPLIGWLGWTWYNNYATAHIKALAERVTRSVETMGGYPARVEVRSNGRSITITGLTPSSETKSEVLTKLRTALPDTTVRDELSVVPGSDIQIPDPTPTLNEIRRSVSGLETEIMQAILRRTVDRTTRRLSEAQGDTLTAAKSSTDADKSEALAKRAGAMMALVKKVTALGVELGTPALTPETTAALATSFSTLGNEITAESRTLTGVVNAVAPNTSDAPKRSAEAGDGSAAAVQAAADTMASEAERLAALASAIAITQSLRPKVISVPVPTPPPAPSARDRLTAFVRENAIFFSSDLDYRDGAAVDKTLDALTPLLREANSSLRIVGYTDDAGVQQRNVLLARNRAERVRNDLLARGVAPNLLIAVGRANAVDLSSEQGADSPNRRVEFELTFAGEVRP